MDENDEPLKWQADNSINTFENVTNNDWIEKLNGVKEYEFVPVNVNEENTGILLLDPNRNIYVELKYVRTIQADLNSRTVKVYLCQEAIMKDT